MNLEFRDIWDTYVGTISPLEFMYKHRTNEPAVGVKKYLKEYPKFFGIVRRNNWRETFCSPIQLNREEIECALTTHIHNSRSEWENQLEQIFLEETQSRIIDRDIGEESAALDGTVISLEEPNDEVDEIIYKP